MTSHSPLLRLVLLALILVPPLHAQTDTSKINIAVMTLKPGAGLSEAEMAVLSDRLSTELFRTGAVNVMERNQIQSILSEQGFQQSGSCSDEACLVEAGQLLGVQQLVSGSVGSLGSLYMVNLRVIDVSSAKIVHVVSDDIKGSIEDVVERLPLIAQRLVKRGDKTAAPGTQVAVTAAARQAPSTAPVAPPPVAAPASTSPAASTPDPAPAMVAPTVVSTDSNVRNNKNRSGIRLLFQVSPGMPKPILDGEETSQLLFADYSHSALRRTELLFLIKAGRFLNVSIGPSFSNQNFKCTLLDGTNSDLYFDFSSFAVEPGISFVKRWYPLKVSAGIMFGFNILFGNSTYDFNEVVTDYTGQSYLQPVSQEHSYFGVGASLGFRGGAELMIGPHVGIGADLVLRPFNSNAMSRSFSDDTSQPSHLSRAFTTASDDFWGGSSDTSSTYDPSFDPGLPKVGIGLSVNFYFGS